MNPRRFAPLMFAALLLSAGRLLAEPPVLDPLEAISQETKTEIAFQAKARGEAPLRFAVARLRKNGKELPPPANLKLDADKGSFAWTPTPSQAGAYELTIRVKDKNDQEASTTVRITVRERSICTAPGAVGDLLRKWYAEGTAAGNTGDFYDNRDRDHSPLNLAPYPQLDVVTYSEEDRKVRRDWALQTVILDHVTFGNSSTSAPPLLGGSNVRSYYAHPRGLAFLYEQYRKNNLYMYPAHHDHHPGHNGKPFYGDVFPANSPYLITSQGSSGTDQPFMRAIPYTLAAFRPEVKKKLIETGQLMPTLQMIFRSTNKHLTDPRDYLTGKAHPTVFEGSWVQDLKMVQLAHDIQLTNIPPLIQLKVVKEDTPVEGRDYFQPKMTETLCDSPAAIARVFRGTGQVRRMVVSAEDSSDLNKHPLTYHWAVLRGDPERVQIKPLNAAGSVVEISVGYPERRPVPGPVALESNRVDIGAFVHNGTYYSAPGFVTVFGLDHEARTYDANGRLLEIGYGVGDADLTVSDWNALFAALQPDAEGLGAQLLRKPFQPEELAVMRKVGVEHRAALAVTAALRERSRHAAAARTQAQAALKVAEDKRKAVQKAHADKPTAETEAALQQAAVERDAAEQARKNAEAIAQAAQRAVDTATRAATDILSRKQPGLELPVKDLCERTLNRLKEDPGFCFTYRLALEALLEKADAGRKKRVLAAQKRLLALGILEQHADRPYTLKSIRPGTAPVAERLTRYERNMLERFQAEVLSSVVYPAFLTHTFRVNLVDQRISTPKAWRDVYQYDAQGNRIGWTRWAETGRQEFNADGLVVLKKDAQGRALEARTVRYEFEPPLTKPAFDRTLEQVWSDQVVFYEYDGPDDRKGRIKKQETLDEKK